MSVVNKMLQDLEARQASGSTVSADYQPPLKGSKHWWYVVLLLIVVSFFGFWLFNSNFSLLAKTGDESVAEVELNKGKGLKTTAKTMLVTHTREPELAVAEVIEHNVDQGLEATALARVAQQIPTSITPMDEAKDFVDTNLRYSTVEQTPDLTLSVTVDTQAGSFQMKNSSQASQKFSIKQQIKDALADNNSALAIKLLGQLLEQEPDNSEVIKKLATLLFVNGNVIKSINLLQSSVQRAPLRGDLRLMLARLYVQQNRADAALAVMQEIQPAQYMEIDYLAYRANLAQQLADYALAKQDYTVLTQVDGNNARWWLGLAITEEKLGAGQAALSSYDKAQHLAQLDPAVTEFIKQRIDILAGKQ